MLSGVALVAGGFFFANQVKQGIEKRETTRKQQPETAAVEVKTPAGTFTYGAGASKLPAWIPNYPGSSPEATMGAQGATENSGSVSFMTRDSIEQVARHYEKGLTGSGVRPNRSLLQSDGKTSGALVTGESADSKRTVLVTVGAADEETAVTITYSEKK